MSSPVPTPTTTAQPDPQGRPEPGPLLTVRTAIILFSAALIGLIVGGLTFFSSGSPAGAVLAGLTGAGASVLGLHKLIS